MRIRMLGGWAVEHDGESVEIAGGTQRALLFRLAIDAGSVVGYRAIAEDLWPDDPPENPRASLQSLVSRLRGQLPAGTLESAAGGYRLSLDRADVDAVRFQDLVAAANSAQPAEAAELATTALAGWTGAPWTPSEGYDWFERALADDHATALRLGSAAVPSRTSIIPAPITELIGREAEIEAVRARFHTNRLVTVLGPGGAGKTRLAIEIARQSTGSLLVELAPAGPDEVVQAIVGAVGRELRLTGEFGTLGPTPFEQLAEALGGRDVVLVLDNCEHVIAAAADAANRLLAALPRLSVLATSREPLGIPGEAFVPLGPLDLDAATELFAQRVLSARGEPLGEGEQAAAARIRERLDGLPLALELAAAKARTMTVDEIAAGLDDRFTLLGGGVRTVLPRHQTLRALVDWSWDLLTDDERRALMVVAAYPGGIAVADAAQIAAIHGIDRADLDSLVDKSLLRRLAGRYRELETIREYGLERLADAGEIRHVRTEQADILAVEAERHDAMLRRSDIHEGLAWFDAEDDNLAAVLRYCVDAELPEQGLRIAASSGWYWILRDRNEDAFGAFTALREQAAVSNSDAGVLVSAIAVLADAFAGGQDAEPPDDEALDAIEHTIERMRGRRGDLIEALPTLISSFVSTVRAGGDWNSSVRIEPLEGIELGPWATAMLEVARAALAQNRGAVDELGVASERGVALFEELGDVWGLALARQMRAEWLQLSGRLDEALAVTDEATEGMRSVTSAADLLQQQSMSVMLLHRLGRTDEAKARMTALIEQADAGDSPRAKVQAAAGGGLLFLLLGEPETARRLIDGIGPVLEERDASPRQLVAMIEVIRAGLDAADGDREGMRVHLQLAATAAVSSRDHPIMAFTALWIARGALDSGDRETAVRALALSTTLRGAPDPTDPIVKDLTRRLAPELAAARADSARGTGEDPVPVIGREEAVAELGQILRR